MLYHSLAIILKKEDFRENDLLLTFYTRDFGKILAVSRGAKKIQSKLAGSLPVFCVIEIMLARGRNFYQLTSAEIFKDFTVLKQDLKKIYLGNYFLEIVNQLTKTEYKDQKIFNLLVDSLEVLNQKDSRLNLKFIKLVFVLKFLTELGYRPPATGEFSKLNISIIDDDLRNLVKIKLDNGLVLQIEKTADNFLKNHLDKPLQSEKFV